MHRVDDELLARYLAGEAGSEERDQVDAWAAADPARASELARLRAAWGLRPIAGRWNLDAAWGRVSERLGSAPIGVVAGPPLFWRRWLGYAAAALVLLTAGALFLRRGGTGSPAATYATAVGAQRDVELPDGSRVELAPASRMDVVAGFGGRSREVTLEGRAWFEVRHDPKSPFRVRTAGAVIEDLGTEFEVLAPGKGAAVQVAVVSGSVAVTPTGSSATQAVRLGPRDVARVGGTASPQVRHEAPVQDLTAWRRGVIQFDNSPLAEIAVELGRWYGLEFRVGDSALAARPFTAPFPTGNLDEVLEILRVGLRVEISRTDSVVTLVPRGSP
jgi:ferric-dicitrate binding protein FerR (iron transport regulator)